MARAAVTGVGVGNGRFRMCSGAGTELLRAACGNEEEMSKAGLSIWKEGLPVIYGREAIGGASDLLITGPDRTLERLIRHTVADIHQAAGVWRNH